MSKLTDKYHDLAQTLIVNISGYKQYFWDLSKGKILTSLLVDLQTSVRGQNEVEFDQESTGQFFLALLLAKIANDLE